MAKKSITNSEVMEVKAFTMSEIDIGIRKLRRRIEKINSLSTSNVAYNDAQVKTAETGLRETVREIYGQNSPEFKDHQLHRIWHGGYNSMDIPAIKQSKFEKGIEQTIILIEGLVGRLEEKRDDIEAGENSHITRADEKVIINDTKVFIVHGHDEEAKQTLARFIEKLKLFPVILSEKPNEGHTIIEKFEKHSEVGFAVILLTTDDIGSEKSEQKNLRPRARQNVILELGYFVGKLGRSRVCALCKGSVETPSDFHGILYIPMDESEGWKLKLASELKTAKLNVDMNLVV